MKRALTGFVVAAALLAAGGARAQAQCCCATASMGVRFYPLSQYADDILCTDAKAAVLMCGHDGTNYAFYAIYFMNDNVLGLYGLGYPCTNVGAKQSGAGFADQASAVAYMEGQAANVCAGIWQALAQPYCDQWLEWDVTFNANMAGGYAQFLSNFNPHWLSRAMPNISSP